MGFWQGMMKMVQGKPVFEDPNTSQSTGTSQPSTYSDTMEAQQTPAPAPAAAPPQHQVVEPPKVTPTIDLKHSKTHIMDDHIEVTAWVTNTSSVDIEVDKCVIVDTKMEIDRRLSPGQAHEVILYRGSKPKTDHIHRANIFYRSVRENEYYRMDFSVEYNREPDGLFTIEDLHPEHYGVKEIM